MIPHEFKKFPVSIRKSSARHYKLKWIFIQLARGYSNKCNNPISKYIHCCGYCSDTYFSHNCENVHESMFCFNVKNRRHNIGNAQYDENEYNKIKSSLMVQMIEELEDKKSLKIDIYNIGCKNKT